MLKRWISLGLAVGLLAAAVAGSAVLASGGDPEEGEPEEVIVKDGDLEVQSIENDDVDSAGEPEQLSVRVAEILGTDPQATHDAMVQADQIGLSRSQDDRPVELEDADSMSAEAGGSSYLEYGNRVGAILGVDGPTVAAAIAQAWQELYAVEREITDRGSGRDADDRYEADKHPEVRNDSGG